MEYLVSKLISDIRTILDLNPETERMSVTGDVDTLSINDIIRSRIEPAARYMMLNAPVRYLEKGEQLPTSVSWLNYNYPVGLILLPNDFLRLITFKMSDWAKSVTDVILEDDPLYLRQSSPFAGIRGNAQRPVVALVNTSKGPALEFYGCETKDTKFSIARYAPIPKISNDKIDIPMRLESPITYYAAHLVAVTLGMQEIAPVLLQTAATQIASEVKPE